MKFSILNQVWRKYHTISSEIVPKVAKEYGLTQGKLLSLLEEEVKQGKTVRLELENEIIWKRRK